MVPSPESLRSKKSFLPSSTFSGVWGFCTGTGRDLKGSRWRASEGTTISRSSMALRNTVPGHRACLSLGTTVPSCFSLRSLRTLRETPLASGFRIFQLLINDLLEVGERPVPDDPSPVDVKGRRVIEVHVLGKLEVPVYLFFVFLGVDGLGEALDVQPELLRVFDEARPFELRRPF